jgi:hypothetical protein
VVGRWLVVRVVTEIDRFGSLVGARLSAYVVWDRGSRSLLVSIHPLEQVLGEAPVGSLSVTS